jgi:hypothetical protein
VGQLSWTRLRDDGPAHANPLGFLPALGVWRLRWLGASLAVVHAPGGCGAFAIQTSANSDYLVGYGSINEISGRPRFGVHSSRSTHAVTSRRRESRIHPIRCPFRLAQRQRRWAMPACPLRPRPEQLETRHANHRG